MSHIPIVDFGAFSIDKEPRPDVNSAEVQQLAKEIYSAFSTVGFVYLKNHGIAAQEIEDVLSKTDEFFGLSKDIKRRYQKKQGDSRYGWDEIERERPNLNRPADLKESFDVGAPDSEEAIWPDNEVAPNFKSTLSSFRLKFCQLGMRVLSTIAIGLKKDPDLFAPFYKLVGTTENHSQLRINYYPKLTSDMVVKPGQIRCGEHTDYGGITLLIQDDAGGLEVSTLEGKFVPATPIPGTIIINIGDLMQRWTSDILKSTPHRVLIPEEEIKRGKPRRSIVLFFDPDRKTMITCLDGSNKYPPVNSEAYVLDILKKTYEF